jgi:hypothetical protein
MLTADKETSRVPSDEVVIAGRKRVVCALTREGAAKRRSRLATRILTPALFANISITPSVFFD